MSCFSQLLSCPSANPLSSHNSLSNMTGPITGRLYKPRLLVTPMFFLHTGCQNEIPTILKNKTKDWKRSKTLKWKYINCFIDADSAYGHDSGWLIHFSDLQIILYHRWQSSQIALKVSSEDQFTKPLTDAVGKELREGPGLTSCVCVSECEIK